MSPEEKIAELEKIILSIQAANESFHTMKSLRVWATDENRELRNGIRRLTGEALELIKETK